jgi:hypothetical protein
VDLVGLAAGHHVESGRQVAAGEFGQSSTGGLGDATLLEDPGPGEDPRPGEDSRSDEDPVDRLWRALESRDPLDQMSHDGDVDIEPSAEPPLSELEVDDTRLEAITADLDFAAGCLGLEPADTTVSDERGDLDDPPLPFSVTEPESDVGHGMEPEPSPEPDLSTAVVPRVATHDFTVPVDHHALQSLNRTQAGGGPADQGSRGEGVAGNIFEPRADLDGVGAAPELSIAAEQAAAEHAEVDPESIVLVVIRGVPEGARLSAGVLDEDGSWLVSPLDLPSVAISLPSEDVGGEAQGGDGDLSITGMALAEDGALAAISETVPLADYLGDPGPGVQMLPGSGAPAASNSGVATEPRRIPLEVDPHVAAHEQLDALVIRDLPAAARLSAGAYDAAINGWVLMPHDMSGLAILPPADLREDFTVTLLGVALRPCEANAVRVLARLPVTLA